MRILIATTHVPFVLGGAEKLVSDLRDALVQRGFETDTVSIPFDSRWLEVPRQTVALRLLDVSEAAGNRIDRLIAVRYPSYALPHPNKVAWFIHHHRVVYDLWGTDWSPIPDLPRGRHYRDMTRRSDDRYLRECRKVFTNSKVVADRLRRFNGIEPAGVLYPPLPVDHLFRPGPFGDYVFYPSRLEPMKRQGLAIEALKYTDARLHLVLAGEGGDPQYLASLKGLARAHGVGERVVFTGRISEEEKARYMTGCCAALYLAYDEDSYGYVTLEAFHAAKPVITLTDSGGPLEVIEDGLNGRVVPPEPQALGEAMTLYLRDRGLAQRAGQEAFQTVGRHQIDWDHVVERLTA